MLHTIPGRVRKQPIFPISMMAIAFAIALIFVTPALGQDESAGGPTTASLGQPAAVTPPAEGATVPRLVTFSGVLKDASGKPATGTVTVAFSVYEFQEAGSPLWVETQAVRADVQGRYTVLLGATQPDGLPLDLFITGKARWVGVQPQLPATAEQPRVLLVGVPYALKAADADTLGGKPASAYLTTEMLGGPGSASPASATSTSTGIQPSSPTLATSQARRKASSTGASATSCGNITADGTATANFVAKFTAPCAIHQSQIFDNGTDVGIGTKSPAAKLDVSAPNQVGLFVEGPESGVGAGLDLKTTGTGGLQWEILDTGATSAQGANKLNIRNVNTGNDVLTILANGNVGIGTRNASTALQVVTAGFTGAQGQTSNSTNGATGVLGEATATSGTTNGVTGLTSSSGNSATGVLGNATASSGLTYGVVGISSSPGNLSAGVKGQSFATSGMTFGVVANSRSATGIGTLAFAPEESNSGFSLIGCCPVGVWGDSNGTGSSGAAGLVGTADDAKAMYLQNNSPSGFPTAFFNNIQTTNHDLGVFVAQGAFGSCSTDTDGNLRCTGTKSAVVPVDSGQRQVALYAVEAPQNWFEDFGSGQLASGSATVALDPTFAQTVNAVDYHVFLTPEGDCRGLYVDHKTAAGFEVHELGGGQSNVSFDYRIVALRRGYERVRLEDMTERLKNATAKGLQPKGTPGPRLTLPPPPLPPSANAAAVAADTK